MKPHEQVKEDIKNLYLEIQRIRRGAICIYPDLARQLDTISTETALLFDATLTVDPDSIF